MNRLFRRAGALVLVLCTLIAPARALTVHQAITLLEERYIDQRPPAAYQAETMDELIAALGDPYTSYLTGDAYQAFLGTFNDQKTVGIGVSIRAHEQGVLISSIVENTPAAQAGLVAGDVILSADGTPITDMDHAVTLLTGEEGSSVVVRVLHQDGTQEDITLTRHTFTVNTTAVFSLSEDGNAGVINCTGFGDKTASHIHSAVSENDESVNAWIVDVRSNPGGSSSTAAGSVGVFAGGGIMLYFRDAQDNYTYTFTHPNLTPSTEKPAIILTSPHSASGAELFAAAMRDHGTGISIGQRTFGKGIAQIVLSESTHPELFQQDALKLTAYRFFSPAGTTPDQGGVLPTLLMDAQYVPAAALLLCSPQPDSAAGYLNITLAGWEFFVLLETALSDAYAPAFVALLEALPPSAELWMDRGNGTFGRVTMEQVLARTGLSAQFTSRRFSDLADCRHQDAINTLAAYGLVSGYGDGRFLPDAPVTRAEFCTMVTNAFGFKANASSTNLFYDVPIDAWYYKGIMALSERGYISAYSDGSFSPSQHIGYSDALQILAQTAAWVNMKAYDLAQFGAEPDMLASYAELDPAARESAWLLEQIGVVLSQPDPETKFTRADAADLLYQLLTATNVIWPARDN